MRKIGRVDLMTQFSAEPINPPAVLSLSTMLDYSLETLPDPEPDATPSVTVSGFDDYSSEYDWWHYSSRFNGTYVETHKATYYFNWDDYTSGWVLGGNYGVFRHTVNTTLLMYFDATQNGWVIQDETYLDPYMSYASYYSTSETPPLGNWDSYYYANDYNITVSQ